MLSKDEVLVVSGVPRTGSAMMMRMLEMAGIEVVADDRAWMEDWPRLEALCQGDADWLKDCAGKAIKIHMPFAIEIPADVRCKWIVMTRDEEAQRTSITKLSERTAMPLEILDQKEALSNLREFIYARNEASTVVKYEDVLRRGVPLGVLTMLDCHNQASDMEAVILRDSPPKTGSIEHDMVRWEKYEAMREVKLALRKEQA